MSDESQGPHFRRWRQRERPEPSTAWQMVGVSLIFAAIGAALAALTVSSGAPVTSRELWLATVALLALAVTCLLAHREVNRGRRSRVFEWEDLPPSDSDRRD